MMTGDKISWSSCEQAQAQAEFLQEQAREQGEYLDDVEAFHLACQDQDAAQQAWQDLLDELTEIIEEINADGYWYATVRNFGWRGQDGTKDVFRADNGQDLLRAILPDTDCTFEITVEEWGLQIWNRHHDNPVAGETYSIYISPQCECCQEQVASEVCKHGICQECREIPYNYWIKDRWAIHNGCAERCLECDIEKGLKLLERA